MTRCPYCGARGVKLADEVSVQGVAFRVDYCGSCGKNWPKDLSARVEADAPAQMEDIPATSSPSMDRVVPFGAKVAELAERVNTSGRDWKHAQAGE